MKVAVIGANGQLGSDLMEQLSPGHEVVAWNHNNVEITDIASVKHAIEQSRPDIVLNTAAYHVVPAAEKEPAAAFAVNGIGALNLARVCQDNGIRLLHYSTDYVFDGKTDKPYTEQDKPNPLNVYANTKLCGEHYVLNNCDRSFVVRVSGIYGKVPCRAKGGNFVTTMLKLAKEKPEVRVVNDEILTPTPTLEIAKATQRLMETDAYGLYHMTSEGQASWYEFARAIWETLGLETPLYAASVRDFPVAVKRPFYSVLENHRMKANGIPALPDWKESLVTFLAENYG